MASVRAPSSDMLMVEGSVAASSALDSASRRTAPRQQWTGALIHRARSGPFPDVTVRFSEVGSLIDPV